MNKLQIAVYQRKMEQWALDYPFAAMMMFGKQTIKEKIAYAEERFASSA